MGMRTHIYLCDFLENLNINLTFRDENNPSTGRVVKTNKVEQENISNFMKQNKLVVNIIESKKTECKPRAPTLSQARRSQAAVKHARYGMIQLIMDF